MPNRTKKARRHEWKITALQREHLRAHCASLETFKSRVRTENHSHKLGAKRELYKLSVQEQGRLSFLFTVAALIP